MRGFHDDLKERWHELSIFDQMANVGAEVGRAISWRDKDGERSKNAFYRALELLDFTALDAIGKPRLKEILRVREVVADYLGGQNVYKSTGQDLNKYFYYFNLAARKNR